MIPHLLHDTLLERLPGIVPGIHVRDGVFHDLLRDAALHQRVVIGADAARGRLARAERSTHCLDHLGEPPSTTSCFPFTREGEIWPCNANGNGPQLAMQARLAEGV